MLLSRLGLAALLASSTVAPAAGPASPAAAAAPCAQGQGLFVQSGRSGRFEGGRLYLEVAGRDTTWFTDRPQRRSGSAPVARFLEGWDRGRDSFAADPPNASFAYLSGGRQGIAIVELSDPRLAGTTLSYRVNMLEGRIPPRFRDATLFIDPGGLMCLVCGCC